MGGKYIDQNRGGSLFWSIFFSFDSPRLNSDTGSSNHCVFPQFQPGGNVIPILVNIFASPLYNHDELTITGIIQGGGKNIDQNRDNIPPG